MTDDYEPGVKLIELVPKRADISDDLFHYHWYAIHGELARSVGGLRRYIQHHRIYEAIAGLPALRYEGIVEAWLDDPEAMAAMGSDPHYVEFVMPHEPIQVDLRHMRNLVARARVLRQEKTIGPAAASIAMGIARRPDLPRADFDALWQAHADVVLQMPGLARYVQHDVVDGGDPEKSGFAAVSFMTFRDVFVLEQAWSSSAGQTAVIADLARFALPSACAAHVTHERRVIWP